MAERFIRHALMARADSKTTAADSMALLTRIPPNRDKVKTPNGIFYNK
ncbi:MAG: hypothetical protein ABGY95_07365 [Rubritalea sp.]